MCTTKDGAEPVVHSWRALPSASLEQLVRIQTRLNGGYAKSNLAQRVRLNPQFYGVKAEKEAMERFLHKLNEKTVEQLVEYKCVTQKGLSVKATVAGNVAATLDVDVETMHFMHLRVPSSELKEQFTHHTGPIKARTALVFGGIRVYQALGQDQWPLEEEKDESAVLMQFPHVSPVIFDELREAVNKVTQREQMMEVLKSKLTLEQVKEMMRVVESVPRWKVQVEGTKKANEHAIDVEVNAEKKMKHQGTSCGVYVLILVKTDGSARVIDHHHVALNPSLSLSFAVAPGDYQVDVLLDNLAGITSSYDVHIE
ncbi:hypothetical protein PsorP6_014657 [Peronosclerospora sorghi]|uniref:Uncharacterized protein n=1 Tax=Peronosclerospora sorghi TaxID=230839 RepID=A0ACC0VSW1_9STRA|nr:hypothetical protein PsorP6_014657 [Peronosclerospora sorghi]